MLSRRILHILRLGGSLVMLPALVLLQAGAAGALPITFTLTGTVGRVADLNGVLGGQILMGDAFTGTLTYDLATPDGDPVDTTFGSYSHSPPLGTVGLSISVNGLSFQTDPSQAFDVTVDVTNNQFTATGAGLGPFGLAGALSLANGDSMLADDSLPTALGTHRGSTKRTTISFSTVGLTRVNLDLMATEIVVTTVPEPGSATLLGLGLARVALRRRR